MKLALVLGKQQGNQLKPRLLSTKDNLDIDCYDSIPEFIDNAIKRNSIYDRILVLSNKVNAKNQKDLHNYWGNTSKDTQIVFLGKTGADEKKATEFLQLFKTTVIATVLVKSTTVSLIAEAVLRPVSDLNKDYGVGNVFDIEVEEDSYEPEELEYNPNANQVQQNQWQDQQNSMQSSQIQQNQMQNQPVQQQVNNNQNSGGKKKSGLLGGLLGGFGGFKKGKNSKQDNNVQQQVQQPMQNEQQMQQPYQQVQQQMQQPYQQMSQQMQQPHDNGQGSFNQGNFNNQNQFQMQENSYEDNQGYDNSYEQQNSGEFMVQDEDFSIDTYDQNSNIHESGYGNSSVSFEKGEINHTNEYSQQLNNSNSFSDDTVYEDDNADDDFSPEGVVDEDFGDMSYSEEPNYNEQNTYLGESVDDSEVESDFSDINLVESEDQYRKTKEAPKVVTQTVVKEVIRNIGKDGKLNVLAGVYDGRVKKTIVISGDRGTGVTSTALSIAQELAKKVDVLYFDCDIYTHGLLNYIDYDNFKNYENNHMNGIKFCRTSRAFDTTVIDWESNLYILTSDFSCDATEEDVKRAADVVAERAVDFGAVIVDCPVSLLHCVDELILTGQSVTCVEGSKRGFMNMLCMFEASTLGMRFKRTFASRNTFLATKCPKNLDLKKLTGYIKSIYEPEGVDWMSGKIEIFNGKLTDKLLNTIMEG